MGKNTYKNPSSLCPPVAPPAPPLLLQAKNSPGKGLKKERTPFVFAKVFPIVN
jgi:hypothetical protein